MSKNNSSRVMNLLAQHPLVSDQVSREQLRSLLGELEKVILSGVNGAVVEFGCYIGTTSLFIRRLLNELSDDREFHAYDSFEGLPPKSQQDASPAGEQFIAGELAVSKKQFMHEFQKANLKSPIIHKGWFSELNEQAVPDKIAFAFLDGDFYGSIRDSLRLVLPRMQPGSTIVFDDYSREALPGVAQAVRELLPPLQVADMVTVHNQGILHL